MWFNFQSLGTGDVIAQIVNNTRVQYLPAIDCATIPKKKQIKNLLLRHKDVDSKVKIP